jgi:hypothetical protein
VRFGVARLTCPALWREEERSAFFITAAVHDMSKIQVAWLDEQVCFFLGLTAHCFTRRFIPIYVTGDDAVLSVFVPRVESLQEKDSTSVLEDQMNFRDESKAWHLGCLGCAA